MHCPTFDLGVPATQTIYLKGVITRIEVHQGLHVVWPLHLNNAHQPHSLQQCHGHPKSDGGAQQCGSLAEADSAAGLETHFSSHCFLSFESVTWFGVVVSTITKSSRPHASNHLEKKLSCITYEIHPFCNGTVVLRAACAVDILGHAQPKPLKSLENS